MKVKFKMRRGSGIYVGVIAGIAFVYFVVTRFNFPVEQVLEFLLISVALLIAIILVAAPVALLIRWWSNRKGP